MISAELISTLRSLDRSDQFYIMQLLLSELAQQETVQSPYPSEDLATRLQDRVGKVNFQPSDLSERTGEAFADLLETQHNALGSNP